MIKSKYANNEMKNWCRPFRAF